MDLWITLLLLSLSANALAQKKSKDADTKKVAEDTCKKRESSATIDYGVRGGLSHFSSWTRGPSYLLRRRYADQLPGIGEADVLLRSIYVGFPMSLLFGWC